MRSSEERFSGYVRISGTERSSVPEDTLNPKILHVKRMWPRCTCTVLVPAGTPASKGVKYGRVAVVKNSYLRVDPVITYGSTVNVIKIIFCCMYIPVQFIGARLSLERRTYVPPTHRGSLSLIYTYSIIRSACVRWRDVRTYPLPGGREPEANYYVVLVYVCTL